MAQPATNAKIEELRFKVKTDPKSRLFYPLAEELRKVGQTDEAERVLRTGLTVHATYLSAWVSLGRVLRDQKKDNDAVEALSKALQLDPGNVVAARLLADAYLALGEKVEAIKKYKLVYALMPDEDLKEEIDALDRELHPLEPAAPPPPPPTPPPEPESQVLAPEVEPATEPAGAEPPVPVAAPFELASGDEATEQVEGPLSQPEDPFSGDDTAIGFSRAPAEPPMPTMESPFDDALRNDDGQSLSADATGDAEPMSVAHEESPFEEPVGGGYSSAALTIEAPSGFQLSEAPAEADVPSAVYEEEAQPFDSPKTSPDELEDAPSDRSPLQTTSEADESEVFGATEPAPAVSADDVSSTITMADLYARQGLTDDARHIYENILTRDPDNQAVSGKLAMLDKRRAVGKLENWLAKVSRKEVDGV